PVRPKFLAIAPLLTNPLVNPIPDKSTVGPRLRFEYVPVLLEIAGTVSNGVGIFNFEKWTTLSMFRVVVRDLLRFDVHGRKRVAVNTVMRFINDEELGMRTLCPLLRCEKIAPVTGLVPHRETDDRGMVLIAFDYVSDPRDVRICKVFAIRNTLLFTRSVSVRLDIRLVEDVKAILIRQFVPLRNIWIVAGPDGVDVVMLHQLDVLNQAFPRHHLP